MSRNRRFGLFASNGRPNTSRGPVGSFRPSNMEYTSTYISDEIDAASMHSSGPPTYVSHETVAPPYTPYGLATTSAQDHSDRVGARIAEDNGTLFGQVGASLSGTDSAAETPFTDTISAGLTPRYGEPECQNSHGYT
jgi:hypothetical protein